MHFCFNLLTDSEGVPGAVLIRALDGIPAANDPARLCRALQIDRRHDGLDLTKGKALWIERGDSVPGRAVVQTTRVGIRVARELPWRF